MPLFKSSNKISTMKFNWGTGIALVYGAFALIMVGVVIRSRQYDPGLVSKDYYNLDLNYQEHFDKKQNAANLAQALGTGEVHQKNLGQ